MLTIVQLSPHDGNDKTLLVFYDFGCGHCQDLLNALVLKYPDLRKQGVDVVGISSADSWDIFSNSVKKFPWSLNLYDAGGKKSLNIKNYRIVATPMMFLIDKSGLIIKKVSSIDDL